MRNYTTRRRCRLPRCNTSDSKAGGLGTTTCRGQYDETAQFVARLSCQNGGRMKQEQNGIGDALADFQRLHDLPDESRGSEQTRLVSRFYDVVTRFYEFAWGSTFHFSPRRPGETLAQSQRRHDEEIGALLNLVPGMQVADFGCGLGGPALTIAAATGATVTGINYNAHQIERGNVRAKQAGLAETCKFLYADYMRVPLPDGSFNAAYSFEAFCHAPDRQRAFGELTGCSSPAAKPLSWTGASRTPSTRLTRTTGICGCESRRTTQYRTCPPPGSTWRQWKPRVSRWSAPWTSRSSRATRQHPGTWHLKGGTGPCRRWPGFRRAGR